MFKKLDQAFDNIYDGCANIYKNYSLKPLMPLLIILLLALSTLINRDFDYFFILENGRKIIESGFPTIDWVSMHDGLHIVIQQWLVAVLIYGLDQLGGYLCVKTGFVVIFFAYLIITLLLCNRLNNKNLNISMITILALAFFELILFNTIRPQLFSLIFITLILFVNEFYIKTSNKKLLLLLPLISILHANCHSTFWIIGIGISFVYLVFDCVRNKRVNGVFILLFLVSIGVGFINPYGYEALLHALYTHGYPLYKCITELTPSDFSRIVFMLALLVIATFIIIVKYRKKEFKLMVNIPILIIYITSCIASVLSARLLMYTFIIWVILVNKLCTLDKEYNKQPLTVNKNYKIGAIIITCVCGVLAAVWAIPNYTHIITEDGAYKNLVQVSNYLKDNDAENKTFIAADVIEGQYLYYNNGMIPYIDGRLETYIKSLNKKEDISNEYYYYLYEHPDKFTEMIDKYNFDYLILGNYAHDSWIPTGTSRNDYELIATFDDATDDIFHQDIFSYYIFKKVS